MSSTRASFGIDRKSDSDHSPRGTVSGQAIPDEVKRPRPGSSPRSSSPAWYRSQTLAPFRAKRGGR
jgi:hypothetical protein